MSAASKGIGASQRIGVPAPERQTPEAKFREVSQLYEKQFMREMVKAMRATVPESGFIKVNQAEKIFRDQLDDEYVDTWSAKGGVGFADIIYDQLMDKFGHMMGRQKMQRPAGPLPLNEKSESSIQFKLTKNADPKKVDITIRPEQGAWPNKDVVAPWSGTLLKSLALGDEKQLVEVDHGQGLLGRYIFKGRGEELAPQTQLKAGQVIGRLSPDSEALYWSLRGSSEEKRGPDLTPTAGE